MDDSARLEAISPLDPAVRGVKVGDTIPMLREDDPGFIYVVGAYTYPVVKIGWTGKPAKRLATIQAHSPVPDMRFLWLARGSQDFEAKVHWHLRKRHSHGEWFDLSGLLAAEEVQRAAELAAEGPVSALAVPEPPPRTRLRMHGDPWRGAMPWTHDCL